MRKFIRLGKARIRRETLDIKEQRERIEKLYAGVGVERKGKPT